MSNLFSQLKRHEVLIRYAFIAGILALGFLTRTFFWFYGYNEGQPGLFIHGDGYYYIASSFAPDSDVGLFDHWRSPSQIVYPLYLAPFFIFGLDPSVYVFCLHHLFVAATTLLIILSGRLILSWWAGIFAGLVYAGHLMVAFWFHFILADIAFHFHAALFMYVNLLMWNRFRKRLILPYIIAGVLLSFVRPEGFVLFAVSILISAMFVLKGRFNPVKIIASYFSLAAVGGILFFVLLGTSETFHEKVFSNLHAGWGLYYGSHKTPTNVQEVDEILIEMKSYGYQKAEEDPQGRNHWYWISMKGIERIKAEPFSYIYYVADRYLNAMFPSFYREGVSWRYKITDRIISGFIVLGSIILFIMGTRDERFKSISLILMAAGIYTIVAFYQSEWDVRPQLSAHVFLLPVAGCGWFRLLDRYYRQRFLKS